MRWSILIRDSQRLAGRVDSNLDTRCEEWINEALQRWVSRDPWNAFTYEENVITNGTSDLFLPSYVRKVLSVFDKDNNRPILRRENWDRDMPTTYSQETSGAPFYWRDMGISPVVRQPSVATKLIYKTDATFDVNCYCEGIQQSSLASGTAANKHLHQESTTLAGGITTQSQKDYVQLFALGKNNLSGFDVEVYNISSTEYLARIEGNAYRSRYPHIQLSYKPEASHTIRIRYIRNYHEKASEQTDNPVLPDGVSPIYVKWYVAGCIHSAMREPQEAAIKWAHAERIMREEAHFEEAFGDQDWSTQPDPAYYNHEDLSAWP